MNLPPERAATRKELWWRVGPGEEVGAANCRARCGRWSVWPEHVSGVLECPVKSEELPDPPCAVSKWEGEWGGQAGAQPKAWQKRALSNTGDTLVPAPSHSGANL